MLGDMRHAEQSREPTGIFDEAERRLLLAVAEAAMPAGRIFPVAGAGAVDEVVRFLGGLPGAMQSGYKAMLLAVESTALLHYRRRFAELPQSERLDVLDRWRRAGLARRLGMRALLAPLKVAHFDNPEFYKAIGCVYEFEKPVAEIKPRYMRERSHAASELEEDIALSCDVVVIGTGAGGAVVARELAEAGVAVVLLEEGHYFERSDFNGRAFSMQRKLYRSGGATFSIGNVGIPIPLGVTVGGTTTVNSGTCYRVPHRVLREWREDAGLHEFTDELMIPYYERVEGVLGVAPAQRQYLGGVGRVIARGCDALGYKHTPLLRNAPACDGKGVCCFGCPTDAKRSTNVSYVPLALKAGAELFHGARVERILVERGRAAGVVARAVRGAAAGEDGGARPGPRTVTVRARAVVVACGAIMTPVLLQENGLCGGSGQLGRNLSIHPAAGGLGVFDEEIQSYNAIPQGYAIEEFHEEGLLFEGAATPLELAMAIVPFIGPKLVELAESFDKVAPFGFMVEDTSRGRVRSVGGRPVITYLLNDRDVARLKRGVEILARVFFAAGARLVHPPVHGFDALSGEADLARLRRASIRASDLELSAYHPLGTARMGADPRRSVVGPDHQAHEVPGLYVVDGASVPSSLGVNPQLTIMAMATRAAEMLARRLS
jgi:choline dehydrogenase-like flavoprotein